MDRFDILIVGSGIAGLSVALAAHGARVAVITPGTLGLDGASAWAQGGIAAALGEGDTTALHARDTLVAGCFHNDRAAVERLTAAAPAAVRWLAEQGAPFDRAGVRIALGHEAAHSRRRIAHAGGDGTGAAIQRVLAERVRAAPNVALFEGARVVGLIAAHRRVDGAWIARGAGDVQALVAAHTVLATGGIGRLWRHTTNPSQAMGDGLALALAAGAAVRDLEFVQFHPTALAVQSGPEAAMPLMTEALRGAGAVLVDASGKRFMRRLHADAELAPRDVVARGVDAQWRDGGRAYLDARMLGASLEARFPNVVALCRAHGLDPALQLLPVRPAAHYHMGGIATDALGATSLDGLFAVGEVACSGVHGANRLASNSLLEGVVAGRSLGERLAGSSHAAPANSPSGGPEAHVPLDQAMAALRATLDRAAGVRREAHALREAMDVLRGLAAQHTGLTAARLTLGAELARAALLRRSSLGAHWRDDEAMSAATGQM